MPNRRSVILSVLVLIVGVYVLDGVNLPAQSRLWREFTNAGHAPLFGVLSIAVLVLSRTWITRLKLPIHHYYLSATATSVTGFLTEVVQYFTPRDASALDMVYNLIGIFSFLLIAASFDKNLWAVPLFRVSRSRAVVRLLAVILFSTAFISFGTIAMAHAHRKVQFPVILDFESWLDKSFLETSFARVDFVSPPEEWASNMSSRVAKWTITPNRLSTVTIQYPNPIWTGYNNLYLEIFSTLAQPMPITLRVNDVQHNFELTDRFNTTIEIQPGANPVTIPLSQIESAPQGRKMDMSSIANIILFTSVTAKGQTLFIDNIQLE